MNTDEIKSILLEEARRAGICREGYERLSRCDGIDALLDFYTANPDWCLERDFPTLGTLRVMHDIWGDRMEAHGVYFNRDFSGECLNDRQTYVFLGCTGKIKTGFNFRKRIIPMLYFARGSRMELESCHRGALSGVRVPLYIFGISGVKACDGNGVKFVGYLKDIAHDDMQDSD